MNLISLIKICGLYHPLHDLRRALRWRNASAIALRNWRANGCPFPPPDCIKYDILREYARKYRTPVFVETGTLYGNSLFSLRGDFRELHSIELSEELHFAAKSELGHLKNIQLHLGDSAKVLPEVSMAITSPALFWLDGHYCAGPSARSDKDTPICEELEFLLARPAGRNVVLIDDARLFNGEDGYPTIDALRKTILRNRPKASCEVDFDIIRVVPV